MCSHGFPCLRVIQVRTKPSKTRVNLEIASCRAKQDGDEQAARRIFLRWSGPKPARCARVSGVFGAGCDCTCMVAQIPGRSPSSGTCMWCIAECARPGGGKTPPAVWDTPERHETDEAAIVSTYGLGMPVGRAAAGTQRLWNPLCLREAASSRLDLACEWANPRGTQRNPEGGVGGASSGARCASCIGCMRLGFAAPPVRGELARAAQAAT